MAKVLTITDPESGATYTLEYTRKSIETMEKQGFVAGELKDKPMTHLPALFAGAFLAHHRFLKRETIDALYGKLHGKDELLGKLVEMYNEPILALLSDGDEESDEGNRNWTANW